jgi:hypothetical protein
MIQAGVRGAAAAGVRATAATTARSVVGRSEEMRRIAAALGDTLDASDHTEDESDIIKGGSAGLEKASGDADDDDDDVAPLLVSAQAIPASNRKLESLQEQDQAVIEATRARLAAVAAGAHATEVEGVGEGVGGGRAGGELGEGVGLMELDRGERWDCESVLSLRSNLDNHPGRIVEPQRRMGARGGSGIALSAKTGMPLATGVTGAMSAHQQHPPARIDEEGNEEGEQGEEGWDGEEAGGDGSAFERRRGETAEERRARKAAVKAMRRDNRAAKKELKGMFKAEATKQGKASAARAAAGGSSAAGGSVYVLH